MIRSDVWRASARLVRAGAVVAAVAALWLLASAPAFAQLSFSSTDFPVSGLAPEAVVASDFNGDGDLDLATANNGLGANNPGGVNVLLGNGTGSFSDKGQSLAGRGPISLDVGDFNADGHVDLAVANAFSDDVSVLLGAGDGTFGAPTGIPVGGCDPSGPAAVVVGFFDADAHPDLAVASEFCGTVSILLGQGDGSFSGPTNVPVGEGPDALASGDFNGDGKLDLVAPLSGNGSGSAAVLLGHGDGTFGSPSVIADGNNPLFAEVAVGDFNGDTKSDLVFAGTGFLVGNISIALGNGDGAFAFPASHALGSSASSVAVADFNADSVPDVATTDQGSSVVWVLPGVGKGNLGTPQSFPAGGPIAVTVGNFNADVLPDMATADPDAVNGNDRVTALLNKTPLPSPAPTVSVAAGGSCGPNGRQGTIELALVAAEHPNSELSLSVTSSNHDLVPTRDITFGGSGASRTLTVSAVRGRSGSAVVTVNRLSDAQLTGSVQVTVRVAANGANSLTGDDGADILFGQNGADSLDGLGGNDLLCGGNGADSLSGGEGDDTLDGGRGPDRLAGGSGADRFAGGPGKDRAGDLNPAEGDTQDGTVP